MESIAAKYLHQGEEIRWTGQPDAFSLLGRSTKPSVLLNWCVTGALTVLFLVWYFLILCSGTFSPVFVGLVLAIAAAIMYAPVRRHRNLQGSHYYITNERAMLVTRDESHYCLELKNIDRVCRIQDTDGGSGLLLGSGLEPSLKKGVDWRSRAVKPGVHTEGPWDYAESMLFFRVADVDGAIDALRSAGVH